MALNLISSVIIIFMLGACSTNQKQQSRDIASTSPIVNDNRSDWYTGQFSGNCEGISGIQNIKISDSGTMLSLEGETNEQGQVGGGLWQINFKRDVNKNLRKVTSDFADSEISENTGACNAKSCESKFYASRQATGASEHSTLSLLHTEKGVRLSQHSVTQDRYHAQRGEGPFVYDRLCNFLK
jgi:hypothetical protein